MSTTRWINWCEEHKSIRETKSRCLRWYDLDELHYDPEPCRMFLRCLVDPDNLPPEAIQRAAKVLYEALGLDPDDDPWESVLIYQKQLAADMRAAAAQTVTAFLSDPEPGDQT